MKKFIILLVSAMLASHAEVWRHSFKTAISALPAERQSEQFSVNNPPVLTLDGSSLKPEGGNYVGQAFYLFKKDAQKLVGRQLRFSAFVRRLEGTAPLAAGFRIFGNGNQFMIGRSLDFAVPESEEWQQISLEFSVPDLPGIENLNVTLGFRQDGHLNNRFLIDEPELQEMEAGQPKRSAEPSDSIGMAAFTDREELPLVEKGIPQFKIYLAEKADAIARYAAEELQGHVHLATGVKVEILAESESDEHCGVWIGDTVLSRKYGVAPNMLPLENWVVARAGKAILLSGGESPDTPAGLIISRATIPLGTLSATCEFLERVFGVRWYWPGELGRVVPKAVDIRVGRLYATGAPAFHNRSLFYDLPKDDPDVSVRDVLIWQRRIRIGGSEPNPIGMHSFPGWSKKYADHPEYFALQTDGKRKVNEIAGTHLCLSNPAVEELAAREAIEYFKLNPSQLFYSVMPGDSNDLYYCRCENCQKLVSAEKGRNGKHSNAVWGFVNAVAQKVAVEAPGRFLKCCSYADYTRRPDFPLQPNIAVTLCFFQVPQGSLHYKKNWRKHIDEWRPTGAKLYFWEYWNNARYGRGVYGAPSFFPRQLKEIYLLDRNQISGRVIELSDIDSEGKGIQGWADWIYDVQNLYFAARLMWNPDLDVEAELAAFYPAFYGPAAVLLQEFYDQLELAWTRSCFLDAGQKVWDWEVCWKETYPPELVDRMMDLLRQGVEITRGQEPYHWRAQKTLHGFLPFEKNSRLFRGLTESSAPAELLVPVFSTAPVLDGELSPDEWINACKAQDFQDSYRVYQDQPAKTEIYLGHDHEYLYVGVLARIPAGPAQTRFADEQVGQRDGMLWDYESIEIFLAGAGRERYQFIFAPDQKILDGHWPEGDDEQFPLAKALAWNSRVEWVTRRTPEGWQLEAMIPLVELVFQNPLQQGSFKVNFARNHHSRQNDQDNWKWEQSCWQPSFGSFHNVDKFGLLKLLP